jgi:hypothetical protein
VINSWLTLSHASAVHKIASGTFVDYENLVMDWKLLEFATAEVNRSFLYSTLKIFMVAWSSGIRWKEVLYLWVSATVIYCHYSVSVLLFHHFANDFHSFNEYPVGHPCWYISCPENWQTVIFFKLTGWFTIPVTSGDSFSPITLMLIKVLTSP